MKFILRRGLLKIEKREIEADSWDNAVKELEKFSQEEKPEDTILVKDVTNIEYIGD